MAVDRQKLGTLYRHRFDDDEREAKRRVWRVLCASFFSRYIRPTDAVLDVGAGYCEFINHIRARRRIAVDANPELPRFAEDGVQVHCGPCEDLRFLDDGTVDVAFSSNFFEHLPDKAALNRVVAEIFRVVKPGGRIIVMGPNVKHLPGEYWDYYDHYVPLTEKSAGELLRLTGFNVEETFEKFLPYSVKSRLPNWEWLVKAYLKVGGPAFRLFGKQFLVIARRPSNRGVDVHHGSHPQRRHGETQQQRTKRQR